MKIFYVTSSSNLSGGSRQALYTARGLVARGHELIFFAPKDAQLPALAPSLDWQLLPEQRSRWGAAIAKRLPRQEPFVVHAHHNKAVKLAAWWGLFWRRKGAIMAAQRGVIYKPNNPLPYWSPGIDCFIVNSQACANVLRAKGVKSSRLHVIHNGIPPERTRPARPPEAVRGELGLEHAADAFIFCCVANDSPNKGAETLLRALALAELPLARLLLLGVTPEKFAPLAAELGLTERVFLPGRREHVADYLQLSQAFVLPSFSESMPNTLQEAVCMGLPVVASDVGGVPECVQGNGMLVPPGDVHALAQALRRLAHDVEQREQWAAASRELAGTFSLENKVRRVENVYASLARQRGMRGRVAA